LKEVSVIISTYSIDRAKYVINCIKSLKKQTLLPKEIILVLDPDEKLIDFYKSRIPDDVKIVISEGYGLSNARNAGVKVAEGEIVAFIDDDAVADKNWLKNLVKNYNDPCVVGVGGFIKPIWESDRPTWFPEELDWIIGCSYKGLPERKTVVRNPIGCNMSFRKVVFEKVGLFKTDVGRLGKKPLAGEEAEFSLRVLEKIPESKIVYDPSTKVYHAVPHERADVKYVLKRSFYEGMSKALIANLRSNPIKALSAEDNYLKHLFGVAVPLRLKRIYQFKNALQLLLLLTSTFLVIIGYFIGKLEKMK